MAAAGVGVVASDELLELLAPTRRIFLPPAGGWASPSIFDWRVEVAHGFEYSPALIDILRKGVKPMVKFRDFNEARPLMNGRIGRYEGFDVYA